MSHELWCTFKNVQGIQCLFYLFNVQQLPYILRKSGINLCESNAADLNHFH